VHVIIGDMYVHVNASYTYNITNKHERKFRKRLHKFTTCDFFIFLVLYDNKICLKYERK